ncbi:HNH endonuclease signature motif containing protein [Gordonia sp. VNK1]
MGDIKDPNDLQQFLAVFSDAIDLPLYLGRARRLASTEQRIASFSRTGGEVCSFPGCGQPASHSEMHHAKEDWADGGKTDITDLAPACGPHNRMVGPNPGQYTTGIYEDGPLAGRCWWQLNAAPGMPENPKIVNDHPDITALYEQKLDQIRDQIHSDHNGTDTGSGAGATEPADTDVVDADVVDAEAVDAETADIEAEAADGEARGEAEDDTRHDHEGAAPTVEAETPCDRGVSSDHPAPAVDSSNIVDSIDEGDDRKSGVAEQPEPGVDEFDSGAAHSDPVEPQPPDQRDGPDAVGGEHPDEPGVTGTGEIDLVIFDGDGVPITDDPDDPDTVAGLDRASRTRIRVRDTATESQARERRIRDGGFRTSDADRERELEELAAIGMNPRNSRIERVLAARLHYRLDTS